MTALDLSLTNDDVHFFSLPIGHLCIFFCDVYVQIFCHFKMGLVMVFS